MGRLCRVYAGGWKSSKSCGLLCRVYAGGWKSSKSCGLLCRVYAGGWKSSKTSWVGSVECMQVGGRVVRVVGCSVECMQVGGRVVRVVGWLCRVYAGGWKSSKSCGLALSSVCRWVEE